MASSSYTRGIKSSLLNRFVFGRSPNSALTTPWRANSSPKEARCRAGRWKICGSFDELFCFRIRTTPDGIFWTRFHPWSLASSWFFTGRTLAVEDIDVPLISPDFDWHIGLALGQLATSLGKRMAARNHVIDSN